MLCRLYLPGSFCCISYFPFLKSLPLYSVMSYSPGSSWFFSNHFFFIGSSLLLWQPFKWGCSPGFHLNHLVQSFPTSVSGISIVRVPKILILSALGSSLACLFQCARHILFLCAIMWLYLSNTPQEISLPSTWWLWTCCPKPTPWWKIENHPWIFPLLSLPHLNNFQICLLLALLCTTTQTHYLLPELL